MFVTWTELAQIAGTSWFIGVLSALTGLVVIVKVSDWRSARRLRKATSVRGIGR